MSFIFSRPKRIIGYLLILLISAIVLVVFNFSAQADTFNNFTRPPFSVGIGNSYVDEQTVILTGFIDSRKNIVKTYFEYGLTTNFGNILNIEGDINGSRDVFGRIPDEKKNQVKYIRFCAINQSNSIARCSNTEIVDISKLKPFVSYLENNETLVSSEKKELVTVNEEIISTPAPIIPDPVLTARTELLKSLDLSETDPLVDWFSVVTQFVSKYTQEGGVLIEINNQKEAIRPMEYNSYRVLVANAFDYSIDNATVLVLLPEDVQFVSADNGVYIPSRHSVVYSIEKIDSKERISYFIHTQVIQKEGIEGLPQLAVGQISFDNPKKGFTTMAVSYDVDNFYPDPIILEDINEAEKILSDVVAMSFNGSTSSGFVVMLLLSLIVFIEAVILIHEFYNLKKTDSAQFAYSFAGNNQETNFKSDNGFSNKVNYAFFEDKPVGQKEEVFVKKEEIEKMDYFGHLGF